MSLLWRPNKQVMGCVYEPDGTVGASTYPLAKKAHSQEFLRSIAHLRPRTKVRFCCVFVCMFLFCVNRSHPTIRRSVIFGAALLRLVIQIFDCIDLAPSFLSCVFYFSFFFPFPFPFSSQMHSAAMRVRHAMAFATNTFFNDRGFLYIHTPIITGSDCEGAGEQFAVSTLLPEGGEGGATNGHGRGGPPMTKSGHVDYTKVIRSSAVTD